MTQIITSTMPMGLPGDLSRQHAIVDSWNQGAVPVTSFGLAVKQEAAGGDKVTGIVAADTSASVVGILVRQNYSEPGVLAAEAFGVATPKTTGPVGVLKQGYCFALCGGAAPTRETPVYVRTAAASAGKPIGGFEAAADAGNSFVLADAFWTGGLDAGGVGEIRYRVGND